jgi:predicted nucleic acid-binding protein
MTAEVFIDTNIFLYSLSDNPDERLKAERARQILMDENWGWSVQVAGEFYNVATSQKRQFRISHDLASEFIESWLNFPTASFDASTVRNALQLAKRFRIGYWDAAIIAAARQLSCGIIYSEDLNANQDYDGVRIINPFLNSIV